MHLRLILKIVSLRIAFAMVCGLLLGLTVDHLYESIDDINSTVVVQNMVRFEEVDIAVVKQDNKPTIESIFAPSQTILETIYEEEYTPKATIVYKPYYQLFDTS